MDLFSIAVLAGIGLLMYFVVVPKAVAAGDRVEGRRSRAVHLATWAKVNGLPILSGVFEKYAVGDYTGTIAGIGQLHDLLADDELSKQAIDGFLKVQFDKALSTHEGRENLIKLVEEKFSIEVPRDQVAALAVGKQKTRGHPASAVIH